jgi:lambda family phage portal protein
MELNVDSVLQGIARLQGADAKPEPAPRRMPAGMSTRMYANAVPTRLNQGFPSYNTSADAELVTSLRNLRSRSRQLVRDAAYAKNAKRIIVNNVVGTGIKLQALIQNTRGGLNARVNNAIEEAWRDWSTAENCHTGGKLHFHDIERMAMGQVFEAGEIFIRIHRRKFGQSVVPIGLEVIEPERVVDGYAQPSQVAGNGQIRMGIEVDEFRRPIAYWIRDLHPGDVRLNVERTDRAERVPAADIFHIHIIDRWPQTRGEPWLHSVAGKLGDMNGYSEAEIIAARGAANYLGIIESAEDPESMGQKTEDGSIEMGMQPGSFLRTLPGEKANFLTPNRPNSAMDPFMRFMLREIAAGTGVSYESLSRDYSQSNYSSTRLALLDDRDVWRALQAWFIRSFRARLHLEFMQAAVLSGAIAEVPKQAYALDIKRYTAAIMRPRGWSWIDPTKEVAAYKEAVKAGFTTVGAVIAQTSGGEDLEDIMTMRSDELQFMDELDLAFDTSPEVYVPAETRGQMIVGPDGSVQPAQSTAVGAAGPGQPVPPEPEPEPASVPADDTGDEPAGAEDDETADRGVRRMARILRFSRG